MEGFFAFFFGGLWIAECLLIVKYIGWSYRKEDARLMARYRMAKRFRKDTGCETINAINAKLTHAYDHAYEGVAQ